MGIARDQSDLDFFAIFDLCASSAILADKVFKAYNRKVRQGNAKVTKKTYNL
jgi:hypothetical protein